MFRSSDLFDYVTTLWAGPHKQMKDTSLQGDGDVAKQR